MTTFEIVMKVIAGLGLFLYGISLMSTSLKEIADTKIKAILEKTTNTPIKGIIVGFLLTTLIQSSSGTTALVVSLISAGLLSLPQAITVIIGANIGSTTTNFLIGLDISTYSPIFILIGVVLIFFFKNKKLKQIGGAFFGFGLLFFGLDLMSSSLSTLTNEPFFIDMINTLSNNRILGFLTGTLLTALIQSSGATIGIIQKLYEIDGSTLTLSVVIPFVIGANLGTTCTGVLASLSGSRNSKRAALFHVIFNTVGVIIFLSVLKPYIYLLELIENSLFHAHSATTIAIANIMFNSILALLLTWFIPLFEKLILLIIPYTQSEKISNPNQKLNRKLIKTSPALAVECARIVVIDMGHIVNKMFNETCDYLLVNNSKTPDVIRSYESIVDNYNSILHDYLSALVSSSLDEKTAHTHAVCLDTIRDLERIGDHCTNLIEFMEARYGQNYTFNEKSEQNLKTMTDDLRQMVNNAIEGFEHYDKNKARLVTEEEPSIDHMEKSARKDELVLMASGVIKDLDLHFVDILSNLERVGDHSNNIAENILYDSLQTRIVKEN